MTSISHEHEDEQEQQREEYKHGLKPKEVREVDQRTSPGGKIVYHAVLRRPTRN